MTAYAYNRPYSDHEIQGARMEGICAFTDGYKMSDNPYDRSTLQWHAWREGWLCEFEGNAND